ncbi:NADP-dependent oxidoreductase RED1 [Exophiala dermatitidis]
MVQNKAFIYKSVPDGWPVPDKDLTVEDIGFDESAPPPKGGFTTKNLYATYDPSQRGRMRDPSIKSYSPAMTVGKPVVSVHVLAKVLKSDNPKIKEGDLVLLRSHSTEEYSAVPESAVSSTQIINPQLGVPLTAYLGLLGMTGMTAYGSLHEIGQPKPGDVILVSAAAGAVGQAVGQIAKQEGLHVIGSVGDDRKLDFITTELGFDAGFNYKKEENLSETLKRLAPNGIDIYYDNVGGPLLDAALAHLNDFGRIVACGTISTYNDSSSSERYGVKNYSHVVRKRLRWQGFIVYDPNVIRWQGERDEKVARWIAEGKIKSVDHITQGMDNAVKGFLGMLKGENLGKSILKIASDE